MPWSDLSDAILNPDLSDVVQILRRSDVVGQDGVTRPQVVGTFNVVAVVAPASPKQLERIDDYQIAQKSITFATRFRVQLASPGFQPDWVTWHGDTYVLKLEDDASHLGPGFVVVVAISIDPQPAPPNPMPAGVNTGNFN